MYPISTTFGWLGSAAVVGALALGSGVGSLSKDQTSKRPAGGNSSSAVQFSEVSLVVPEGSGLCQEYLNALKDARARLDGIADYEAVLIHQVRKGSDLRDAERIHLKVRHQPFSVYMKWADNRQEALYVEGQNDGKMIARKTNGLRLLRGTWRLDPDSTQAMKTTRYPITAIGMKNLVVRILDSAPAGSVPPICACEDGSIAGETCRRFEVTFASPADSPDYSRSVVYIGRESSLPLAIVNYGWEGEQPGPLLERYIYENVRTNAGLNDRDFDPSNQEYGFDL